MALKVGRFGSESREIWLKSGSIIHDVIHIFIIHLLQSLDANGGVDFDALSKFSLEELQKATDELPSGVDPKCKEVTTNFYISLTSRHVDKEGFVRK